MGDKCWTLHGVYISIFFYFLEFGDWSLGILANHKLEEFLKKFGCPLILGSEPFQYMSMDMIFEMTLRDVMYIITRP